MTLNPSISLSFDGHCEAAFKFYERCLGGRIAFLLTWGNSPMAKEAPLEWGDKILYARLTVGDTALVGADALPKTYEPPRGFAIMLSLDDSQDAKRLFDALAEGGAVRVPLQETFWALRYGAVTDRFGIPWEINCEKDPEQNT
jgi:PhnB protein